MKRPTSRDDEHDVVTHWRKQLCYLQRPGVTDGIKRRMRRRECRQARREIRREEA